MPRKRVLLLADESRPKVAEAATMLRRELDGHLEIAAQRPVNGDPLEDLPELDVAIAIGGDGTLISQARRLVDLGLPLIGVNTGRLGFLAEFDCASLIEQADIVFGDAAPSHDHLLLQVHLENGDDSEPQRSLAMNDAVITSGAPFRMIELALSINGADGPRLNGDGMIVATPVGSTAYNVSAGGPIVHPQLEALTITPLAAHSLAFRPLVLDAGGEIRATLLRANEGTTLIADGQPLQTLRQGDTVVFTGYPKKVRLILNPSATYWRILQDKLRWAAPPTYRDEKS
ncbi:MAG: hypothetical protein EA377_13585 [Phycisphaerales bacterium]|nr:MAG: hypothetical protein EA377_13585 [Phycisphaerales bacterium]